MPKSAPRSAPEHHHRGFEIGAAVKMDVFSFWLLCLWILYHDVASFPSSTAIQDLKQDDGDLKIEAYRLMEASPNVCDNMKDRLGRFFQLTLARNPTDRAENLKEIMQLLW